MIPLSQSATAATLSDSPRAATTSDSLRIRWLGRQPYASCLRAMRRYSRQRHPQSPDAIWLLEHPPTVTLGLSASADQVLAASSCPVVRCDRGGQATWHGPGQLVGYLLLDLRRLNIGVRTLVRRTEEALLALLCDYGLNGQRLPGRPGIYLPSQHKIAALGFRVHRHFSYHGFSLNVDCDLGAFGQIHPCGVAGQQVTRLTDHRPHLSMTAVRAQLVPHLLRQFAHRGD